MMRPESAPAAAWLLLLGLCVAILAAAPQAARRTSPQSPGTVRAVYVMALDDDGEPILDLLPDDLEVKENGEDRPVIDVSPARAPLYVALIVDDNGTGLFRAPVANFIQRLLPYAVFSIVTVTGQPLELVDYTRDTTELIDAIRMIGVRPATPEGGQLLPGIAEAARDLRARGVRRSTIVVLTVGGVEQSTLQARDVLNHVRDSGASLNVFSVVSNSLRAAAPVTSAAGLLENVVDVSEVLGDGPSRSGGVRSEFVGVTGSLDSLQRLAAQLPYQYRVSYALPAGVEPSNRLEMTVTRPDVVLRAPTRIPR